MLSAETKRHIDAARDVLVGVAPNPMTQIDQITYALIYKFMDDMDQSAIKAGGDPSFFTGDLEPFAWSKLVDSRMGNQEKMNLYGEALQKFAEAKQLPELFRTIFRAAFLPYRSPETLGLFLKEINFFDYTHPEELGNAYEYLLSIMSAQGDAGQFRTPRHIIDFVVDVINPTKNDTVLDPACGTGGFLVSSYNHILEQHDGKNDPSEQEKPLTPDERKKLMNNFEGYDIDPSMVRIAQVNMFLHQFKNPKIFQYDSLTSEERWNDKFDVILANPPFMSPKGGIKPHNKFALQSNRSEVLFVDYISTHLKPDGRAAIIVPEGIIFQAGKAYKQLRRDLVEGGLHAVVSLPSGVFQPYSGVKTSILFLDNSIAKLRNDILFVEIENDGYELGASKRPIEKNDLPHASSALKKWIATGEVSSSIASSVPKVRILENGDLTLSGRRFSSGDNLTTSTYEMVRLDEVANIRKGSAITAKEAGEGNIPVIAGGQRPAYFHDVANRKGNVITVSASGAYAGFVNYFEGPIFASDCSTIEALDDSKTNTKFLYFMMKHLQNDIYSLQQGGGQPHVYPKDLMGLLVPNPEISIQNSIVHELDGYLGVIEGAQRIISNWKPDFEVDSSLELIELGDIATLQYGLGEAAQDSGSHRFVRITDINQNGFLKETDKKYVTIEDDSAQYVLNRGDLLVARTGATYGKSLYFDSDEPSIFAGYLIRVIPEPILTTRYLWAFMQSKDFETQKRRLVSGGGQPQFNANALKKVRIPVPTLEAQSVITANVEAQLSDLDSVHKLLAKSVSQMRERTAALWEAK
jgi:type I restriction enzyme M protein